jgi:Rps23 Pro-64 3,4-dihydroxylase Tpa1-like proline 4-hydroxylase
MCRSFVPSTGLLSLHPAHFFWTLVSRSTILPDMPAEDSRPSKRVKLENEEDFHPELLAQETRVKIAAAFKVSKPYLHCKIDQLMNDSLLRQVRNEIFDNLHFTLKETDIYKVRLSI